MRRQRCCVQSINQTQNFENLNPKIPTLPPKVYPRISMVFMTWTDSDWMHMPLALCFFPVAAPLLTSRTFWLLFVFTNWFFGLVTFWSHVKYFHDSLCYRTNAFVDLTVSPSSATAVFSHTSPTAANCRWPPTPPASPSWNCSHVARRERQSN